jgi:thiosulfate reductase/polysulfide reductase chain A
VVSLDHGWWFPERGGDFGVFESNANVLTSPDPPYDPAFGSYQRRGLLWALEKA